MTRTQIHLCPPRGPDLIELETKQLTAQLSIDCSLVGLTQLTYYFFHSVSATSDNYCIPRFLFRLWHIFYIQLLRKNSTFFDAFVLIITYASVLALRLLMYSPVAITELLGHIYCCGSATV